MIYEPEVAPDPVRWLALGESERIRLVAAFHHHCGADVPNIDGHCSAHVAVENQLALGEPAILRPVLDAMLRAGLTRHDALHAVAAVLMTTLKSALAEPGRMSRFNEEYAARLAELGRAWAVDPA